MFKLRIHSGIQRVVKMFTETHLGSLVNYSQFCVCSWYCDWPARGNWNPFDWLRSSIEASKQSCKKQIIIIYCQAKSGSALKENPCGEFLCGTHTIFGWFPLTFALYLMFSNGNLAGNRARKCVGTIKYKSVLSKYLPITAVISIFTRGKNMDMWYTFLSSTSLTFCAIYANDVYVTIYQNALFSHWDKFTHISANVIWHCTRRCDILQTFCPLYSFLFVRDDSHFLLHCFFSLPNTKCLLINLATHRSKHIVTT